MKSIIISAGMFVSTLVWSQHIFELQDTVGVYSEAETVVGESSFKIPVNFDAEKLLSTIPDSLKDLAIYRIDLAYTTYCFNPNFDQVGLNNNRVFRLKNAWPELNNPMIQWHSIAQSGANNAEVAKTFFHGFVVYYRPAPTLESIKAEIALLDEILLGDESEELEVEHDRVEYRDNEEIEIIPPLSESDRRIGKVTELNFDAVVVSEFTESISDWRCVDTDTIDVVGKKALKSGLDSLREVPNFLGYIYSRESKFHFGKQSRELVWFTKSEVCDSTRRVKPTYMSRFEPAYPDWMKKGDYAVVKSVFERNPTWKNTLVVMDVTGSMSPYIAKTMAWIKATQEEPKVNAFVFFNDGDNKKDRAKKVGSVGGVYGTENEDFNSVYKVLKSTMRKGGGGDCPENNIEATLYGVNEYNDCAEVIMIADNWATPRDLSLVKDLEIPVHIILCGVTMGALNIDYLQLAYDTGGSVHTIEDDLDMKGVKPGEQFKLGNSYYTIVKGRIVRADN